MGRCRICGGDLREFGDFGMQPLSSGFLDPDYVGDEYFFRLAVGVCAVCSMVQLVEEVPRHLMFNGHYPYLSSGSSVMRKHFERTAQHFLDTELTDPDAFLVELGCNDGIMLRSIAEAGVRHLGVEPSESVADIARRHGVRISTEFFQESTATEIRAADGPAHVIYAANTVCHIPYLDSIFRGVEALLAPDGVFVFEDPYLADIVAKTAYDQIYDEHFYYFSVTSVAAMADRFGFELVDVERLAVHGGGPVHDRPQRPPFSFRRGGGAARRGTGARPDACGDPPRVLRRRPAFPRRTRRAAAATAGRGADRRRVRRDGQERHGDQLLRDRE